MRSHQPLNALYFLAGLALGTGVGLLLAPAPGANTRQFLSEHAGSAKDYLDRGRELYEKGRELADEAAQLYEEGRRLVEG